MNRNQWEHNGDCSKCRRKEYCSKECSAHKRAIKRVFAEAINQTPLKKRMDAVKAVLYNA